MECERVGENAVGGSYLQALAVEKESLSGVNRAHSPDTHDEHLVLHHRKLDIAEHLGEPEQSAPVARCALREYYHRSVRLAPDGFNRLRFGCG